MAKVRPRNTRLRAMYSGFRLMRKGPDATIVVVGKDGFTFVPAALMIFCPHRAKAPPKARRERPSQKGKLSSEMGNGQNQRNIRTATRPMPYKAGGSMMTAGLSSITALSSGPNERVGSRWLAEHHAVALERAPARPIVDQADQFKSAADHFTNDDLRGNPELASAQEEGRREVDDGEHPTRPQRAQQAAVDARGVGQMVIHAAQHDRVAAVRRQSGLTAVRFDHRHIVEFGGDHCLAKPPQASWVDIGRKDMPVRSHLPCKGEGQFTLAGTDVSHHCVRFKGEHLSQARHFAALGSKAEPAPVSASRADG